jgi:anti-sigma B factor antagonist
MPIYIVEKDVGGIILLSLRGRITLGKETEVLRSKIKELLDAGRLKIILDLGEVIYIDSVGLSTLVASYTTARKGGGDLKLLRLPRGVHHLLQITRLSTVFEIYNDLDAACRSFSRPQGAMP